MHMFKMVEPRCIYCYVLMYSSQIRHSKNWCCRTLEVKIRSCEPLAGLVTGLRDVYRAKVGLQRAKLWPL
jgi:hypothetical protein